MAAADYALCDGCEGKVFYDADTDIPVGTVIMHVDCMITELAKVRAAAESRGRTSGYAEAVRRLRARAVDIAAYDDAYLHAADYLEASTPTTEEPS